MHLRLCIRRLWTQYTLMNTVFTVHAYYNIVFPRMNYPSYVFTPRPHTFFIIHLIIPIKSQCIPVLLLSCLLGFLRDGICHAYHLGFQIMLHNPLLFDCDLV